MDSGGCATSSGRLSGFPYCAATWNSKAHKQLAPGVLHCEHGSWIIGEKYVKSHATRNYVPHPKLRHVCLALRVEPSRQGEARVHARAARRAVTGADGAKGQSMAAHELAETRPAFAPGGEAK